MEKIKRKAKLLILDIVILNFRLFILGRRKESRRTLEDIKVGFVGWWKIVRLAEECMNTPYYVRPSGLFDDDVRLELAQKLRVRDRALVVTAFLTGGRISEVLMLRRGNFRVEEDFVVVHGMPLLKRYERKKKLVEVSSVVPSEEDLEEGFVWEWNKEKRVFEKYEVSTTPVLATRNDFPIPRWEPLCNYLVEYVEACEDWLFPTCYQVKRRETVGVERWIREKFGCDARRWLGLPDCLMMM